MKADNGGGQSGQQVVLRDSQSTRPRLACWELEGAGKGGAAGSLSQRNRAPGWGERKKKKETRPWRKGKEEEKRTCRGRGGGRLRRRNVPVIPGSCRA